MAGTPRGSIEHFFAGNNLQANQNAFVAAFKHFDADPNMNRIASNYGSGGAGFDYSTGANPPGENAYGVWTKTSSAGTYYVLLQYSYNNVFGTAPGNPGDVPQDYGVGIQIAYDTTGSTPWNGTTNNNGLDVKGTPVWVANGGNLVVLPRANGTTGTFATNKEAAAQIYAFGSINNRFHVISDDDYIAIFQDQESDADYNRLLYIGPYTAADGVTPDVNLCMYQTDSTIALNTDIGTTLNNSLVFEGGASGANSSSTAQTIRVTCWKDILNSTQQPNAQSSPVSFDGLPLVLYSNDSSGLGTFGVLGFIELVRVVSNVASQDTNADLTKVFLGNGSVANRKLVVDWDGVTVPGSGATITGVQF